VSGSAHFDPAFFRFLKDLKKNNTREWFHANKARYHAEVRDPAIRFIADFAPHLKEISPHFRADPRPVGGSLFRINRDIRFSKDKSPYKTAVGIQFRHDLGKDAHAPGFYLHLEPGTIFTGMGSWRPDGPTVRKIRERIVEKPDDWRAVRKAIPAEGDFDSAPPGGPPRLGGDSLKRAPRGFDPEHPLIEDLKRKDFIASIGHDQKTATGAGFIDRVAESFRAGAPLVAFLCRSVDAPF
jgi:uncharacterized protein (TIGR02453 family)